MVLWLGAVIRQLISNFTSTKRKDSTMKMIEPSMTCQKAIRRAISVARATGSATLMPEHFILAMLYGNNSATRCLRKIGAPIIEMRNAWIKRLPNEAKVKHTEVHSSMEWNLVMNQARKKAQEGKCESVNVLHVFVAIIDIDSVIKDVLETFHIAWKTICQFLARLTESTRAYLTPQTA